MMVILMSKLMAVLFIEFFILLAPIIFILADLWSGVKKAKIRGERITSRRFRDTIRKIARYYNVLLVLGVMDALHLACSWYLNTYEEWSIPMFPWLSLLCSIAIGLIEVRSIMEPANEKERRLELEVMELTKALVAHPRQPEEIAAAITDFLKADKERHENEKG